MPLNRQLDECYDSLEECQWKDDNELQLDVVKPVVVDDIEKWEISCQSGVTFLHLNIRSLHKNWDEFKITMQNRLEKVQILILTEVSVQINEHVLSYYALDGYTLHYKTRQSQRGGGLFMYVLNNVQVVMHDCNFESFEYLNCTMTLRDACDNPFRICVLAIYRPPHLSKTLFVSELEDFVQLNTTQNCIIIGDTNLDIHKTDDNAIHNYERALAVNGFCKCVNVGTREEIMSGNLTSSCIDHIFIRGNFSKLNSVVVQTKISDHYLIGINIENIRNKHNEPRNNSNAANFKKFNESVLKAELNACDWDQLLTLSDSQQLIDSIQQNFKNCYNNANVNAVKMKPRTQQSWMTKELKDLLIQRDHAFHRWKKCACIALKNVFLSLYMELRRSARKEITKAKNAFFDKKFQLSRGDVKKSWQNVNSMLGKRKKMSVDEIIDNYLGKKFSISYIVNKFANSFVDEVNNVQHTCNIITVPNNLLKTVELQSMYMPRTTVTEVSKIISAMDIKKSPGFDQIRIKDLQFLLKKVSPLITNLINSSLRDGHVPSVLKISVVRPVFKKEDHLSFSNYRPISLLPIIEKIMERCIAEKLTGYLTKFEIINKNQFGFQKKKSTSDLLEKFSNVINSCLNENKHALALFIDFTKAFDTLCHTKLICALENIGIRGPLLQWFCNYLDGRQMLVKINKTVSDLKSVRSGVPQGSILGPLLYLIYVNDMFKCAGNCHMFMYADDTVLVAVHRELEGAEKMMQSVFTKVLQWTHDNNLICNARKTKIMHICSPLNHNACTQAKIIHHSFDCLHSNQCNCSTFIEEVNQFVYLGLIVDRFFSWKPQTEHLCRRLRSVAFGLYKLRSSGAPLNILRTVYLSLAESQLLYGLLVWGQASEYLVDKIMSIQTNIIKIISPQAMRKTIPDIEVLFQKFNILPIRKLFEYRIILKYYFVNEYKILKSECLMKARLRNKEPFIVPNYVNKHGKRLLEYTIPLLFNQLPPKLQNIKTYSILKILLKEWISGKN
jgi:hypothetical protein